LYIKATSIKQIPVYKGNLYITNTWL